MECINQKGYMRTHTQRAFDSVILGYSKVTGYPKHWGKARVNTLQRFAVDTGRQMQELKAAAGLCPLAPPLAWPGCSPGPGPRQAH